MLDLKNGYAVRFRHGKEILGCGADANTRKCYCELFHNQKRLSYCGATCDLRYDRYDKEVGRKLSLRRAMKMAGLPRDLRKKLWAGYFARLPEKSRPQGGTRWRKIPTDSKPMSYTFSRSLEFQGFSPELDSTTVAIPVLGSHFDKVIEVDPKYVEPEVAPSHEADAMRFACYADKLKAVEGITADKRFEFQLPGYVQIKIGRCCSEFELNETGGILIGKYSKDQSTVIIVEATSPPKDSQAGPHWFHRGTDGLDSLLSEYWNGSERAYYVGEWHYHPSDSVVPSEEDIEQMRAISSDRRYQCREPIMLIIGRMNNDGKHPVRAFVFPEEEPHLEFIGTTQQACYAPTSAYVELPNPHTVLTEEVAKQLSDVPDGICVMRRSDTGKRCGREATKRPLTCSVGNVQVSPYVCDECWEQIRPGLSFIKPTLSIDWSAQVGADQEQEDE